MLLILPIAVASVARIEIQNDHQADAIKSNVAAVAKANRQLLRISVENRSLTVENHSLVKNLQAAIVESCEQNGAALRKNSRETLREEIREAEHPNPEALHALIEAGVSKTAIFRSQARTVVKLKKRLERIKSVNCEREYQISPGSGERRRSQSTP